VTKPDIGAIRIFGRETKFEIIPASAEKFAAAVRDAVDDGVKIEPCGAPAPPEKGRPRPERPPPRAAQPADVNLREARNLEARPPRQDKPRPYNPMDAKPGEAVTDRKPDWKREDKGGPFKVGPRPFKKKPGRKSNDQRPGKPYKGGGPSR